MIEIMIVVVSCLIFFIPGKILDEIFAFEKNEPIIRIYSTFIFALFFSSLVGIILSNFGLYTTRDVWIIYLSIFLLYLIANIKKIRKIKETVLKYRYVDLSKDNIIIFLVLVFTIISFLTFQRYDFPVGHDATKHYLNIVQLIEKGEVPNTELGSFFQPFYPRGFHFSATTFSFLCLRGFGDIFTILKMFLCIVVLFFPISICCLSRKLLSKDLEVFSLLFFLYFLPLITTRGNYPMMVSALCLGLGIVYIKQYLESEEKKKDIKLFLSLTIILFYSLCSHLIYTEYFYLIIISLVIFEVIAKRIPIKKSLFFGSPILFSIIFSLLLFFFIRVESLVSSFMFFCSSFSRFCFDFLIFSSMSLDVFLYLSRTSMSLNASAFKKFLEQKFEYEYKTTPFQIEKEKKPNFLFSVKR